MDVAGYYSNGRGGLLLKWTWRDIAQMDLAGYYSNGLNFILEYNTEEYRWHYGDYTII